MSELTIHELNRILDRSKTEILLGKNATFFGTILCSLETVWTERVKTAATNGIKLWINTDWWLTLSMPTRRLVLKHELEHIARLHPIRRGDRNIKIWNQACDAVINQFLIQDGEYIGEVSWFINLPEFRDMAEEAVYDIMLADPSKYPEVPEDIVEPDPDQAPRVVNNVIRATQQTKMTSDGSDAPAYIQELINKFMQATIPWEVELREWCTALVPGGLTWSRPNRRYSTMYMPSKNKKNSTLEHLMYFLDTSASITDEMVVRFNTEIRYIKEVMNPKRLTLVQFDTDIRQVQIFFEEDGFEVTEVIGRGNTSLSCVKDMIEKTNPTAVVVFSDLECSVMQKPTNEIPIIWVVLDNPYANINWGKMLHISV